jgi:hypothetical protein
MNTDEQAGPRGPGGLPFAGVAYHDGPLSNPAGSAVNKGPVSAWNFDWGGYDWMLHSDQWSTFRSDRVREFYTSAAWANPVMMTINNGTNGLTALEYSDWAVAATLIYNCTLTSTQVQQVGARSAYVAALP